MISDTFVSVVIPLRDTAATVEAVVRETAELLGELFRHYEIVLVDDCSRDETVPIIERLQKEIRDVQLYCLNRRSGIEIALVAGLDNSIGDAVITLNPETDAISMIAELWRRAQQGSEIVCGVRKDWLRPSVRAWLDMRFCGALESTTGLSVPAGLSHLRLYSRRVVGYIGQNNDRHLLLKVLPFFSSHRVARVEYEPVLTAGGFGEQRTSTRAFAAMTVLLASSIRPLRMLTLAALGASSLSLVYAIYVVGVAIFKTHVVEGWVSLALPMAIMFLFMSIILGMLSEYIYMLSQQSGNRPIYSIVKESASGVLEIQRKLNVVEASGDLSNLASELSTEAQLVDSVLDGDNRRHAVDRK